MFIRTALAAAVLALLASAASAQSLTTQDRINARQVIAEQGVFLDGKNLYADYGWSNGQRVSVYSISRDTFKTSDGKTVPGFAVANELSDRRGSSAKTSADPE